MISPTTPFPCSPSLLAPLLALLLLSTTSPAADWPMHRGDPQLQGVASIPTPQKPRILWQFKSDKPVKGAAAIAQGRVFFGDDSGKLHALDLASGKELWSFKSAAAIEATPLVLGQSVYVGSSDSFLYALHAETGALLWKYQTEDKILGGANHAKNPQADNQWILVGSYDANLHCVDATTGKLIWKHPTNNFINGTPAVTPNGEIIFGGCDSAIHILQLADGKELRQIETDAYIASSIATADGLGYVGNYGNFVLAFNPKTAAVLWKYRDRNFPYFSSAALTADRVILGGRDKRLHCIDRSTGKGVWTFQTRGEIESSPVVCGNGIVVGSADGRLYCVDLPTGKELWAYEIGAPLTASPAVSNDHIVIGAEDGTVYCFGTKP